MRDSDRVVPHFQEQLATLKERLLVMGGLAEERVRAIMEALVERDLSLVERVQAGDEPLNQLHIEIDDRCFKLLALHQPMAADLRAIVSAVKINTDLERVGDLAVNIAEAVRRYLQHPPVKKLIDIPRMAEIAQKMLRESLDAFVRRDVELAQGVLNQDDLLDTLKTQVFRELLTYMLQDQTEIEPALDLILISRHLERIGDHATNVAEDVIFMVSARDVRHHPPVRPGRLTRGVGSAGRARAVSDDARRQPSPGVTFPSCPTDGAAASLCILSSTSSRGGIPAVLQRTLPAAGPLALGRRRTTASRASRWPTRPPSRTPTPDPDAPPLSDRPRRRRLAPRSRRNGRHALDHRQPHRQALRGARSRTAPSGPWTCGRSRWPTTTSA